MHTASGNPDDSRRFWEEIAALMEASDRGEDLDFTGFTFPHTAPRAIFEGFEFKSEVYFSRTRIPFVISFRGARFLKGADFDRANFTTDFLPTGL
jgi:hypothetical protein